MEDAFVGALRNVPSGQLPEGGFGTLSGQERCLRNHEGIGEATFCVTRWTQLGNLEDLGNGNKINAKGTRKGH